MILATYEKQPSEEKDYDIDYSQWLLPMGDSLDEIEGVSVECITDPTDTSLVYMEALTALTATTCKLWVSGGTAGFRYKVTVQVRTVGRRLDESELIFKIRDY